VKSFLNAVWAEDQGVLTFEWILLITVVVIGIVGGLCAVRDGLIDELGDVTQAMLALDQSYKIGRPLEIRVVHADTFGQCTASDSAFIDSYKFADCSRACDPPGQRTLWDDCFRRGGHGRQ
jgi:hypothetical protein